ncbi:MAG: hypothetical protein D6704_11470 [Nitrospirae bacterium]|nr:MAG: hypothetical protein D6704_11470 [Nitrospirota bacterium]
MKLSVEQLQWLQQNFDNCVCPACLAKVSRMDVSSFPVKDVSR